MGCLHSVSTKDSKVRKYSAVYEPAVPEPRPLGISLVQDPSEVHALDYNLIANSYRIAPDVIGSGYYGKILLASHVCNPELRVAIKTLNKKDMLPGDIKQVKNEIQLLSRLDHPNICKYHETYESPNFMYIVMEYCQGTDLFTRLTNKSLPRLTEKEVKEIFK
jgi:hypothetical protein